MLTSHLQHGHLPARHQSLSSTVAMRTSTTNRVTRSSTTGIAQTRSHWGWRRPGDYCSHIDPMFYRFHRYRSLKTKAKQIDKMRRRSRWDWDAAQHPSFNAKHIRFASHFGDPKYHPRKLASDPTKPNHEDLEEGTGFELTEKEKEWKEQMKRMRKRIEQDPYEAVFGKRFPPFWSPLLSPLVRWTGEELGLKTDAPAATKPASTGSKKTPEPVKPESSTKKDRDLDTDTPNGQLTNYSYSASTAWDSRTNKTRGQEWDSVSGVSKSFEYDPISNRMIEIRKSQSGSLAKPLAESSSSESDLQSSVERRASAVQTEPRKSIEVPTATVDETNKTSLYFPSLLNTAVTPSPAKTSAITKAPESDLDLLTAEDIRASMRGRQDRAHYSTRSSKSRPATLQPALQRMQTKESPEPIEPDDSAAHESTGDSIQISNIPRDWDKQADLLQANRIERTRNVVKDDHVTRTPHDNDPTLKQSGFKSPTVYMHGRKVEENGRAVPYDEHARVPANNDPTYRPTGLKPPTVYMDGRKTEENGCKIDEHDRTPADNDPTLDRHASFKPPTVFMHGRKVEQNGRKIESDEFARTPYDNDPTMDKKNSSFKPPTVYKNGAKLQGSSDDKTNYLKPVYDPAAEVKSNYLKPVYDPAADKESKYRQKVVELKRELDLSYEQSTINSEMHVERIRELERALEKARAKDASKTRGPEHIQAEGDFDIANITKYAKDSSKWYKQPTYQPAVAAQASQAKVKSVFSEHDVMNELLLKSEKKHGITYKEATEKDTLDLLKEMAEKDRQISESRAGRDPFPDPHSIKIDRETAEKYEHKPEDTSKLLADYAEQDRQIRETRAGRNPFPDPLFTKVDKEIAEEYKHKPEDTKKLLAEYAEKDRQIRESRAGRNPFPDPLSVKVDKEMAEKYKFKPEDTAKLLEADAQRERDWAEYVAKKNSNVAETSVETKEPTSCNIQWADPPVYKVLAYDSGNDMFSTATTSSNFTTQESAISIQDALSQLYQPARFVPHFAQLQKEGFQIIFGTKDLLLFKKRQDVKPSLLDHGLARPTDTQAEPITSLVEPVSSKTANIDSVDHKAAVEPKEPGKPSYVSPGCPNHAVDSPTNAAPESQTARGNHETKQSPRVYREERVFSGRKKGGRGRSELTAEEIELLRKLKGNGSGWASRLRWALGVGVGASAVAYGVGAAVEKKEMRDRERWEDVLEGKSGRRRNGS